MTSDVLHRRAGWALYVGEDGDYAWLFGWEGQGLLVVSVEPYGIDAYHHREDETATVNSARELWEWLKLREDDEDAKGGAEVTELRRQLREMSDEKLAETLP
ncbi:hypothetical protein DX116_00310 [Aeromicrobium endophyticum]|uniref:Uncharacterized protein n=2 Tax=Aeromicrobium endophyticum TaxID=2292704 RepID=A0A371P899_9ACTN|nr:hypothetical protein DX116_00310 [Aeromicrobium endophyticum]